MADEDETRITIDEINETLRLGVDAADEERASELETFLLLRAAREAGLRSEQERLSQTLAPDHPRLRALALRIEANAVLGKRLGEEAVRARTDVPESDPQGWVLQGRLTGVDPASLRNHLVALFDRAGKRLEGTESPIDEFGRFLIKLTFPAAGRRLGGVAARSGGARRAAARTATAARDPDAAGNTGKERRGDADAGRETWRRPNRAPHGAAKTTRLTFTRR